LDVGGVESDDADFFFDPELEYSGDDSELPGVVAAHEAVATRFVPWVVKRQHSSPYPCTAVLLSTVGTTLDLNQPFIAGIFHEPATGAHVTVGRFLDATTRWKSRNKISDTALGQMFALLQWTVPEAAVPTVRQVTYLVDQVMGGGVEVHDACPAEDCVLFRDSEFEGGQQYVTLQRCPECSASRYKGASGASPLPVPAGRLFMHLPLRFTLRNIMTSEELAAQMPIDLTVLLPLCTVLRYHSRSLSHTGTPTEKVARREAQRRVERRRLGRQACPAGAADGRYGVLVRRSPTV